MEERVLPLLRSVSKVKPWAAIATVAAMGLIIYYSVVGVRFWLAASEIRSLNDERKELTEILEQQPVALGFPEAELRSQERRLDTLRSIFNRRKLDQLAATLSDIARGSSVDLTSVTSGGVSSTEENGMSYETQPITIALSGQPEDVYRFIFAFQRTVPTVEISTFRITGFEGVTSVQVDLLFYTAPRPLLVTETLAAR